MPSRAKWRAELLAAAVALSPAAAGACDLAGLPQRVESATAALAYRIEPALTVGVPHVLEVGACAKNGSARLVAVDAFMPGHGHGTNYRTEIAATGPDRWRAEGLLLHMPGAWQLWFDIETPAGRERLVQEVEVE